jgi:glycosyltransferase involved in cell wall biosynthesis
VPTYNRADLIAKTLQSLLHQQYKNYEIIVVDDGSTDNTEEVVTAINDSRITYIKKNNAERAAARNFGAAMAKGAYVNFFDSDDLALPHHLEEAEKMVRTHTHPEWFHLSYAIAKHEGQPVKNAGNYSTSTLNKKLINGNLLSCNGVFVRKDIILIHKFNEDRKLSASEDYELWCRLASRFPLFYSNTITSFVVDHDMRSVCKINGDQLIQRLCIMVSYLQQDASVQKYFGNDFNQITMYAYSYIAVHLSDQQKFKLKSIEYLIKAFNKSAFIVKQKIFYAIIKNLIVKW